MHPTGEEFFLKKTFNDVHQGSVGFLQHVLPFTLVVVGAQQGSLKVFTDMLQSWRMIGHTLRELLLEQRGHA